MADLLSLLQQAASSLNAHRADAATASNNLSNVNTPGYARQRAELEALSPADRVGGTVIGRGVGVLTVSQARDRFLESQIPASLGQSARSSAQSAALESVTALNPDGGAGLSAAFGEFYGSLQQLSQNPGDLGLRQAAVSASQGLTLAFNRAGQALASARTGIDANITGSVDEINSVATKMASLNKQIAIERASGGQPNDLLDARLKAQDRLATLTGAVPIPDAQGNIGMALPGGAALVSGDRSATLSTIPDAANRGHLAIQFTGASGAGPVTAPAKSFGGSLGGMLDARDGALATAERGLDTLAFDFATSVNTVHSAGFGMDGTGGRDLFTVTATPVGAAMSLEVGPVVLGDPRLFAAASTASAPSGDASNLLAIMGTQQQALSSGANATTALSSLISQFGAASSGARSASETDGAINDQLQQLRESASGVSIDEEMVRMTAAQRAFEAVTKVVKTADDMLQTLLSMK